MLESKKTVGKSGIFVTTITLESLQLFLYGIYREYLRILIDHVCNTHQFQLPSNIYSVSKADTALSDTPLTAVSGFPGSFQVNKLPGHL